MRIRCPVLSRVVAWGTFIMAGIPNSLATMAPWDNRPPHFRNNTNGSGQNWQPSGIGIGNDNNCLRWQLRGLVGVVNDSNNTFTNTRTCANPDRGI